MPLPDLNDRERRILEAVIQTYVETAEPTGSRSLARRFGFDVSLATIRNTMSDLEEKGYLYHPHTSAGRVPTDMAYRMYVDSLIRLAPLATLERDDLMERIAAGGSALEMIMGSPPPGWIRPSSSGSSWFGCRPSACSSCSRCAGASCGRSSSRCPTRLRTRRS